MKRQAKKGLAILLILTMLIQAVPLTAMAGKEDLPEKILAGMTLEDKVSQMMVLSLRGWAAEDGTAQPLAELNDTVRGYLAYRHV
jgi:hypothetical protein